MQKKKWIPVAIGAALTLSLCACSGGNAAKPAASGTPTDTPAPVVEEVKAPDLTGQWECSLADDMGQKAVIVGDTITIDWTMSDGTTALYWVGTFEAPTTADEPYTWVSQQDKSATASAIMASGDDTKEFTYEGGKISYAVSIMGVNMTAHLEKVGEVPEDVKAEAEAKANAEDVVYKIGDTWKVDGQWSLTIDSVEETSERNEFADKTPAAVYILNYHYTNDGYEDSMDVMNGLYLSLDTMRVVDSAGTMGYYYPGNVVDTTQETPVGATCKAQACIGVDNAGSFTLHVTAYDGNNTKQSATFQIDVNQ